MSQDVEVPTRYEVLRSERRLMTLAVSMDRLGELVLGKIKMTAPDLPADAIHVNTALDFMRDAVVLAFVHESFEPVEAGCMAPMADFGATYTLVEGVS